MSNAGRAYALWLIPADDDRQRLSDFVDELARRFNTPRFAPHATLCSGRWSADLRDLTKAMDDLSGQTSPVCCAVDGIGQTKGFFTFFYIKLIADAPDNVFNLAIAAVEGARLPAVGPHVSLIYSDAVAEIDRSVLRNELADRLPARIVFDSMQLVMPAHDDWQAMDGWKVKHTAQLIRLPGD